MPAAGARRLLGAMAFTLLVIQVGHGSLNISSYLINISSIHNCRASGGFGDVVLADDGNGELVCGAFKRRIRYIDSLSEWTIVYHRLQI